MSESVDRDAGDRSSIETSVIIYSTTRLIEPFALGYLAVAAAAWAIGLVVLPYVAAGYGVFIIVASVVAARGRLTVGPEGITAKYLLRRVHVAWPDIWEMSVEGGFVHRFVRLRWRDGRRISLPALRAPRFAKGRAFAAGVGVVQEWSLSRQPPGVRVTERARFRTAGFAVGTAVFMFSLLLFDRPWYWVAPAEASQVPDPCAVLTEGSANSLGLTGTQAPAGDQDEGRLWRSCVWSGSDAGILLTYVQFARDRLMSGTGVAAVSSSTVDNEVGPLLYESDDFVYRDITMADEASVITGDGIAKLVVRRANVIVVVVYGPLRDAEDARARVTDIGREAVAALDIH